MRYTLTGVKTMNVWRQAMRVAAVCLGFSMSTLAAQEVDNSALDQAEFRTHHATYGLVYRLPAAVQQVLDQQLSVPLQQGLAQLGLVNEARTFNLPHITVVHLHNADPTTPRKMLHALSALPAPMQVTLKGIYPTEAAAGAGAPWWLDLGVVKQGPGYQAMMAYNTLATAALTPLRDGPLPRCTGPVFARMSPAAKELTRSFGLSGVNRRVDGQESRAHNPHSTLVYSMTPYDAKLAAALQALAQALQERLPEGLAVELNDLSIVEIGFMGNVLREFYRIDLATGKAWDVSNGEPVSWPVPNARARAD